MKLAAGQAEIDSCPYVTEEVKAELSEAAAPPVRTVEIGSGEKKVKIGGEVVMYRHEKTFFNPTLIALYLSDEMSSEEVDKKLEEFQNSRYQRVGQNLEANLLALEAKKGDLESFKGLISKVLPLNSPLILMAPTEILEKVVADLKDKKPLLSAATSENYEKMAALARENNLPLVVKGKTLDEVADLTEKIKSTGFKDMVIEVEARGLAENFKNLVLIRRAAIEKKIRSLGYPVLTFAFDSQADGFKELIRAAVYIVKYGGIVVLSSLEPWKALPLFVLRQNIYTDPQRPLQVEEKFYRIGQADKSSPVLITTNFSLTYFIVSSEVEASKVPAWLGVVNTEGLSVLTAWSAGKFNQEIIAQFVRKQGMIDLVSHKKIVIPGYVAQLKGALEDELPGYEVIVGPREASEIPAFLKTWQA
jgi:acetyl-CoA decarbonylase/synthase complex subunit gamma